jgi:hypothetical protein
LGAIRTDETRGTVHVAPFGNAVVFVASPEAKHVFGTFMWFDRGWFAPETED